MDNSAPVPDPRLRAKFLLIGEKVRVWEGSPKNSKLLDGYSAQAILSILQRFGSGYNF